MNVFQTVSILKTTQATNCIFQFSQTMSGKQMPKGNSGTKTGLHSRSAQVPQATKPLDSWEKCWAPRIWGLENFGLLMIIINHCLAKCVLDSLLGVEKSDQTVQSLIFDILLHNVWLLPHNWIIFLQLIDSVPQILLLCWDSFHLCFWILHHPLYLKDLRKKKIKLLQ